MNQKPNSDSNTEVQLNFIDKKRKIKNSKMILV